MSTCRRPNGHVTADVMTSLGSLAWVVYIAYGSNLFQYSLTVYNTCNKNLRDSLSYISYQKNHNPNSVFCQVLSVLSSFIFLTPVEPILIG